MLHLQRQRRPLEQKVKKDFTGLLEANPMLQKVGAGFLCIPTKPLAARGEVNVHTRSFRVYQMYIRLSMSFEAGWLAFMWKSCGKGIDREGIRFILKERHGT